MLVKFAVDPQVLHDTSSTIVDHIRFRRNWVDSRLGLMFDMLPESGPSVLQGAVGFMENDDRKDHWQATQKVSADRKLSVNITIPHLDQLLGGAINALTTLPIDAIAYLANLLDVVVMPRGTIPSEYEPYLSTGNNGLRELIFPGRQNATVEIVELSQFDLGSKFIEARNLRDRGMISIGESIQSIWTERFHDYLLLTKNIHIVDRYAFTSDKTIKGLAKFFDLCSRTKNISKDKILNIYGVGGGPAAGEVLKSSWEKYQVNRPNLFKEIWMHSIPQVAWGRFGDRYIRFGQLGVLVLGHGMQIFAGETETETGTTVNFNTDVASFQDMESTLERHERQRPVNVLR